MGGRVLLYGYKHIFKNGGSTYGNFLERIRKYGSEKLYQQENLEDVVGIEKQVRYNFLYSKKGCMDNSTQRYIRL